MKNIVILSVISALILCGCHKKYDFNRSYYESFFPHYVERCDKFIEEVDDFKNCDVCFLGDSITEGYPVGEFYSDLDVCNRGISGDFTGGVIDRLEFCVYDVNPKIVYLMIGTNNVNDCMENYEDILLGIKKNCPNTKVLVMSITPRWGESFMEQIRDNNVEIEKLAGKYGYFYVNAFTPLTVENKNLSVNDALFFDGLHPNIDGYKVITDLVRPTILEWLK